MKRHPPPMMTAHRRHKITCYYTSNCWCSQNKEKKKSLPCTAERNRIYFIWHKLCGIGNVFGVAKEFEFHSKIMENSSKGWRGDKMFKCSQLIVFYNLASAAATAGLCFKRPNCWKCEAITHIGLL